jgi:ATP-dependent Zn protease
MSKLPRVAYHEASHAVACVCFELAFQHVSIIPEGTPFVFLPNNASDGRVKFLRKRRHGANLAKGITRQRKLRAEREILMFLAGREAATPF